MKILVVSGFLGSGKTTFIKELIRKTKKSPVILENEYGQNSLDSNDIAKSGPDDLKLLDFVEGCVCCTKKDSFSNTILTISSVLDPEYLVVEPTGVGKLSNILAAIKQVSYEKIEILKPIVILTPSSFDANMKEFGEICVDQIKYASRVVFSKIENEDPAVIERITGIVREINPNAEIVSSHYSTLDPSWWNSLLLKEGEVLEEDIESSHSHGDVSQVSFNTGFFRRPAELIMFLEDILRGEFGILPRAKGVIKVGNEWMRFDVADRKYAIIQEELIEGEEPKTQVVFIGKKIRKNHLSDRLNILKYQFSPSLVNKRVNRKK